MHALTGKRVQKFATDFGFIGKESELFERYVASVYLHQYLHDNPDSIEASVLGGGNDEGIDIAAVIVNGSVVFEPEEIDELIADHGANSARIIFIQAKTSEAYDTKLISKFLHGVESVTKYAMKPESVNLPPRLVDLADLIERIAESLDKFQHTRIPCELYFVTTSAHDGKSAQRELQVTEALRRIREIGVFPDDLALRLHGREELAAKQKERYGPQNVPFLFEKHQTIPATENVEEAYIGLLNAAEVLKLLKDENGEVRAGIFDDNVRLDLGANNPVNRKIMGTLQSDRRDQFPFLNNGLTVMATGLSTMGDRFRISGYQIVNGGQTSHQIIRWSETEEVRNDPKLLEQVWVPVKIVSSTDSDVKTAITVATNLQTAIDASDIQSSSQAAKDVEEFFEESGSQGLRYARQNRGNPIEFARTRIVTTTELNRAVASTIFGESSRAIAAPKDLERQDSFVWDSLPIPIYYYAAWIIYRVDRYFGRNLELSTLRAAKYHIAMASSLMMNNSLLPIFESSVEHLSGGQRKVLDRLKLEVESDRLSDQLERAIEEAVDLAQKVFEGPLSEGRSLRKDDVRNRRSQEAMLDEVDRKLQLREVK